MKKVIELSDKEFVYLAIQLGANFISGIQNKFVGMNSNEINESIPKIQNSLISKECLQMNFDGTFFIDKELEQLMQICIDCEKYIGLEKDTHQGKLLKLNFYKKENRYAKIRIENGHLYISKTSKAYITQEINDVLISKTKKLKIFENVVIPTLVFENMCESFDDTIKKQLLEYKVPDVYIGIINSETERFYLNAIDYLQQNKDIIMAICSEQGNIEVSTIKKQYVEHIKLSTLNKDMLENRIREILIKMELWEEVTDFR